MTFKTSLFSSTTGDVLIPITATSLDVPNIGQNAPVNAVVNDLTITGQLSGAGVMPAVRQLPLTDVKTDAGVSMITATAATTLPGITRTAGTSMFLNGATTSGAQTVTTKMLWEFNLPNTYVAGASIPVNVNCVVATATNVTASTTTMAVAAYSESTAGLETSLAVSAAQQIPLTTAGTLTFSVNGTGLTSGQRITVELTMAVTTTVGGASFGQVNSIGYVA